MSIRSYRDLRVWTKAMDLASGVVHLTRTFPSDERFGLTMQMRKAAVSIPSNLAEGHERHSRGDYRRHVSIALGSLAELETQLDLGSRLEYADATRLKEAAELAGEVGGMLSVLLRRLRVP